MVPVACRAAFGQATAQRCVQNARARARSNLNSRRSSQHAREPQSRQTRGHAVCVVGKLSGLMVCRRRQGTAACAIAKHSQSTFCGFDLMKIARDSADTCSPKIPRYLSFHFISFLTTSADTVALHWDCERGVLGTTRYLEKSRMRFLVFSIAQIAQIKPAHGDLPSQSHRKTSPVCHQCRERRPCVCGGQGGTIPRIRAYLPGHAMFGPRA